jgi:hypothetical protein
MSKPTGAGVNVPIEGQSVNLTALIRSVPSPKRRCIHVTTRPHFQPRGRGDYYGSHDLEDIVAVIDGRARIVEELEEAETSLRAFVQAGVARLMSAGEFHESLAGHLPFDEASQRRLPGLRKKLQALATSLLKPPKLTKNGQTRMALS